MLCLKDVLMIVVIVLLFVTLIKVFKVNNFNADVNLDNTIICGATPVPTKKEVLKNEDKPISSVVKSRFGVSEKVNTNGNNFVPLDRCNNNYRYYNNNDNDNCHPILTKDFENVIPESNPSMEFIDEKPLNLGRY